MLCFQLPDPSHALDTVLFALLYLVWPLVFAVGMFLFVLKLSFAPPDDQDVERCASLLHDEAQLTADFQARLCQQAVNSPAYVLFCSAQDVTRLAKLLFLR